MYSFAERQNNESVGQRIILRKQHLFSRFQFIIEIILVWKIMGLVSVRLFGVSDNCYFQKGGTHSYSHAYLFLFHNIIHFDYIFAYTGVTITLGFKNISKLMYSSFKVIDLVGSERSIPPEV